MSNFEQIINQMKVQGMNLPSDRLNIKIPNARTVLANALTYFLKQQGYVMQWLPEYEEVAKWLSDSQGRGLFMYGNCGRGKSILGRYAIPAILLKYCQRVVSVYDVQDMNAKLDEVLSKHILSLDDIGTEEMINNFGNKRLAFAEIMDLAEKKGKLIIISTNLNKEQLEARYGDRIFDRIKSTTFRVVFNGKSLRQ